MPRDDHDTLDIKDNEEDITVHAWAGGIQTLLFYEQATGELSKGHCEGKPIWT